MAEIIPTVLVDSVIMIDHFNGISAATQYLLEMRGHLAISVITHGAGRYLMHCKPQLQKITN